jgi:signal transduction histidine kinase/Na+/proline symporter
MQIFVLAISLFYLAFLFWLAFVVEKSARLQNYIKNSGVIYSISLAIYCTAWTFYGSIGKASVNGIDFLPVYIGPTLLMPLWYFVMKKMIRISKMNKISTLADFLSLRYGVSIELGMLITVLCIIGIVPYISLQIKAISDSFEIILSQNNQFSWIKISNLSIIVSFIIGLFIIIFGAKKMESNEYHSGIVASVAFESVLKLVAFLVAGIFIVYFLFDSPAEIYDTISHKSKAMTELFVMSGHNRMTEWFWLSVLSAIAVVLLPRQFQIGVIENQNEAHLKKAIWIFPLYLFLINLFVLPIAFAGNILFDGLPINPDYYILDIPLKFNAKIIGVLVFLGGFSAASAMIIIEVLALSNMLSNNFLIPLLVNFGNKKKDFNEQLASKTLFLKQLSVVLIMVLSLIYYHLLSPFYSLVSIGLISFVFIAQFFPALLGALYWKKATKKAVFSSLIMGFVVWLYTLVLPSIIDNFAFGKKILEFGPYGISWLKPLALFGLTDFNPVIHGFFWSMFFNFCTYIFVSLNTNLSNIEKQQAHIFVDVFKYSDVVDSNVVWRETALISDIQSLLIKFIGEERTQQALLSFSKKYQLDLEKNKISDPRLIPFAERILSAVVGPVSARILVSSVITDKDIFINEVVDILKESREVFVLNKELTKQSTELSKAKEDLEKINNKLIQHDQIKDEFLATVSHELKSPITSIKSFAEILKENEDISKDEIEQFSGIIYKESERITRLINQLLDLERYDSGKQKLVLSVVNIGEFAQDVMQLFNHEGNKNVHGQPVQYKLNVQSGLNEMVFDRDKIYQVCINLLSNATKFTRENGEITLSIYKKDKDIFFEVKDEGNGIDEKYFDLIFEKFFQARNQDLKKPKGSGLGLAICKKIVQLHGGEIYVKASSKEGSTFVFDFPEFIL